MGNFVCLYLHNAFYVKTLKLLLSQENVTSQSFKIMCPITVLYVAQLIKSLRYHKCVPWVHSREGSLPFFELFWILTDFYGMASLQKDIMKKSSFS